MYDVCLHCHRPLGRNEVIEHFSVGKRLAFDSSNGRLWVVCPGCRRWNLTPLEERWEAIEECEREFSHTRLRTSTDNIGLARVPAGLDLVRVGAPKLPEMAAWRYGESLARRRTMRGIPWAVLGTSGYAIQLLVNANVVAFTTTLGLFAAIGLPVAYVSWRQSRVRVMLPTGQSIVVRHAKPGGAELEPDDDGWAIRVTHKDRTTRATGVAATHTLRGLLTAANFFGARGEEIRGAVSQLEQAGSASYVGKVAAAARATGSGNVNHLPPEVRFALEMALHEESERRALEGELALLREEWRVADEVARIADDMFVPAHVLERLRRLEGRTP